VLLQTNTSLIQQLSKASSSAWDNSSKLSVVTIKCILASFEVAIL
jgi:hypothetical protein